MEEVKVRQTKLLVDLEAIKHNILEIDKHLSKGTKIMPVIKANAYGVGIDGIYSIIKDMDNIEIVGVAIVDEGIYLRKLGYKKDIFILNQSYPEEIEAASKYNLTLGVSSSSFIEKLGNFKANFKIHIEIGTGMGRTGIRPSRFAELLELTNKYKNIVVEGIYTHFACSDCDKDYTKKQISSFEPVAKLAKEKVKTLKYIHACNSAGLLNFPEAQYNLVRPGLILYGYLPSKNLYEDIDIKPACTLKSKVSYIKEVPPNTNISYAKNFTTNRTSIITTVPIGYADGMRRILTNNGFVVINNFLAPIVGTICMDSFMVDVTDVSGIVDVGTDVYIWDNKNITLEDVASRCNTINYEILSTISARVKREYY